VLHLGPLDQEDGFDGTTSWGRAPGGEVAIRDAPDAIARARTSAWMTRRGYLHADGTRYRDLGARDDRGRRLRGVEATPEHGSPIELWFDGAGNLARTSQQVSQFVVVTQYSDWRDVDGLRVAFETVVDRGDPRSLARLTTTEVHRRPALPDVAYAPPSTDTDRLRFVGGTRSSELTFELVNNHIYVRAAVDGHPVRMLLDTGGVNLLTPAVAKQLDLASQGNLPVVGPGSAPASLGYAHGKTLQLGDVVLADPVFGILDVGMLADVEGEDLDGVIGYELFSRLAVRIDYPAHRLTLTAPPGFVPPPGAISVSFEMANRIPIVHGTIDGLAGRFWVDTGSRLSLTTMSKFTRDHKLVTTYHPRFKTITGWGIGGAARSYPVRLHEVTIGGATLHDVVGDLFDGDTGALTDPDAAANLGAGVLRRFVVTFDYAHHTLYLEPGKATDEREIYDRSGLVVIRADHGLALQIAAITPTGPAERAGLHDGDRILAIDGAAIETRHLWQWRAYLRDHPPGTRVALRIARAGAAARDVAITLAELVP
jgi:hypothetical protein